MYRKIIISMLFISIIGCKEEKAKKSIEDSTEVTEITETAEKVIGEISISGKDNWEFRGIKMTITDDNFMNQEAYKLEVIDHVETFTFVAINNIKIAYTGGRYRINMVVKPNKENNNFGIRIQEVYPYRFDAVFDLDKGEIRDTFKEGDFVENEKVLIEPIGQGWYKCIIDADIYSSYFRLCFGPTNVPKGQTGTWEAESLNDKNREILMVPNSIKIEELEN